MSVYGLAIDPPAAISGRTELDLNAGGLQTDHAGVDWGEAAIKAFLAEQQYGESAVSFRVPNRVVTIPLMLGADALGDEASEEEARRKLNEKVALLQREGGVLLRQRAGADALYADIMTAAVTIPDIYGETGAVEPGAVLKLECLPDFYGDEITLDALSGEGQVVGVLKQAGANAVIKGDYPARTRIALTEGSEHDQRGALWGLRSRFYDASASAALFYDAHVLTPINGALTEASTSPTYSGDWLIIKTPQAGIWHPFMTTDIAAGPTQLTHVGSYRVFARVYSFGEGQQLRMAWSLDDAVAPTYNPAVTVSSLSHKTGEVVHEDGIIVDLGEIRLSRPPVGEHWWRGIFQLNTGAESDELAVDRVWLQPVDDGVGRLRATATPASTLLSPSSTPGAVSQIGPGTAWTNPEGALEAGTGAAQLTLLGAATSEALALEDLGLSIPGGSVITGIKVDVQQIVNGGGTLLVALLKAGAATGTPKVDASKRQGEPRSYGSASDTWGAALTPADVSAEGFGVSFTVHNPNTGSKVYQLGHPVTITVYYQFSESGVTEDAVLYSTRASEIRFDGVFREDVASGSYVPVSECTGDLPRLPPSGLEHRPVELLVKASRGDLTPAEADGGIDKITAQVLYRPCYIGRI